MKRILPIFAALAVILMCAGCMKNPTLVTTGPTEPSAFTTPSTEPVTKPTQNATEPSQTEPVTTPADTISLLDFLQTAVRPVGSTMYIWGGGWNEEDTGAGVEAVTLGVSPKWAEFAAKQDGTYNYKNHKYQIHDGLDCSGYAGWAVYNTLEKENGRTGYVCSSTEMARNFADRGLGTYIPVDEIRQWVPGDIMSMKGHVWIVVGMCEDGSVLLLHASPPGVMFSGTRTADGGRSDAVALAETIMREHYPQWYSRYPDSSRPYNYLTKSSAMRWSADVLTDEEGLRQMSAEEVVAQLFGE